MRRKFTYSLLLFFVLITAGVFAQGQIIPRKIISAPPVSESVSTMMSRATGVVRMKEKPEFEGPDRFNLPGNPFARPASIFPFSSANSPVTPTLPQILSTNFNAVTGPTETGAFPPDNMGTIGPAQYIVFVNGRIRSFNKTTGVADGVLNIDPDVFFATVMTPPPAGEITFTSDPNIRYDRLTARWYMTIIDVILNAGSGAITRPNRILIAVSDAASAGIITAGTVWTLYQFQGDATLFTDYTSLGVDEDALYIGGDMFTLAGAFNSTKGFVIPKAPLLAATPLTIWAFSGLVATPTGAGPWAPRGVDNFDVGTNEGYFIGVDNATFNTLMLRRITNPGSLGPAPTISANISIAAPLTTRFPVLVPHLGNTGGTNGRLDALDDRLFAAVMRNGRLWTAHNIGVNNTGVAGATNNRNAARWYEVQLVVSPGVPSVLQSGTIYDNNATNDANQRNYWMPTIMVTGQGHAALSMCIAGTNERINTSTAGRLFNDVLGSMQLQTDITASTFAYNPPGDPGGPSRRWGDYSFIALDPLDDMTMWMINEYCNATNTYGCRVTKLLAPPPATPASCSPPAVNVGMPSVNVTVTGTAISGSGFYDPGANLPAPALPFNHISATVSGGVTVNSVTYTDPTHVTLNISTVGASAGSQTVTIINPDGQSTSSATGILLINSVTAGPVTVTATAGTLGPVDYPTVKDAFDAINAGTHQGAITISVTGNTTETATASLNASGTGSSSYTSVNMTATVPVVISGSIVGAIIKLNGADNVTIDGRIAGTGRNITVSNTSNTTATAALWLSSTGAGAGASGNLIRNCNFTCGADQSTGTLSTFGIISGGATISTASAGDDNDNNTYITNFITKCRYGISIRGNATGPNLDQNTTIAGNLIGPGAFGTDQIGKVGVYAQFQNNCTITQNEIRSVGGLFATTTSGADRVGIGLGSESWSSTPSNTTSTNFIVTRNYIHDIVEERTFSAVGILSSTTNGSSPTNNLICSNMIYNVRANGTAGDAATGIGISGGDADNVLYNSVRMDGDIDPVGTVNATQTNTGLRVAGTPTNLSIKNNILYVDFSSNTGTLLHACIQVPSATFAWGTGGLNYNDYYFPPASAQMNTGAIGTTSLATTFFTTLATWQAALTPAQDANSVQADPIFTSATNLHINGASAANNSGVPVGCTIDFDGDIRSVTTPDMGADENGFGGVTACVVTCPANITVTATGPSGAVVTYPAPTTSGACGTITTLPPSGTTFPIGTTTVNAYNNASQKVYGLTTTNGLVTFNVTTPGTVSVPLPITGLQAGENLLGIDVRPLTGELYGLGSTSRIYIINTTTGAATQVGSGPFSPALSGSEFGMDFNPTVDRIRIVSNTGQNLRINPITGANAAVDGNLNPGTPEIVGIAYTNNYALAASTTLYDIDANTDALYIQTNPNGGTLALVGAMGVNTSGLVGFDVSQTGNAYALLTSGAITGFYTINLVSGAAVLVGNIPGNNVRDITIAAASETPVACSFTITVLDICTLTCPANITRTTDPNQCGAVVTYPPPTVSGSCGTVTTTPASGSFFPKGTTTVTATSSLGPTCTFTITVNDNQAPTITCPANITRSTDPNQCGAVVTYTVTATDNCPGVTIVSSPASGSFFPKGTTTVTSTATDASGNTATCTFTVTVNDTQPPSITCPANITVTTPIGSCTAVVTWTIIATDNCPGVTVASVPPSGSTFVIGTTTVSSTATDASGNTATCSFTVTVLDAQLPVITTQPANRTVCAGSNAVFSVVATNAVSYQWQQFNGSTWVNVAGATGATLTLPAVTIGMNTNTYRVNVIGLCTTVTSGFATLYVNPLPTIILVPSRSPVLLPGQSLTLTATVSPGGGTFVWFKNGVVIPGVTGGTLSGLTVDDIGTYRAVYTDLNGCVATSADLTVSGQPSGNLYVYPNPNNGQFQVRFFNLANEQATINIYDEKGARVYSRSFTTTIPYTRLDVDISRMPAGKYLVEVVNSANKRIGAKWIILAH